MSFLDVYLAGRPMPLRMSFATQADAEEMYAHIAACMENPEISPDAFIDGQNGTFGFKLRLIEAMVVCQ